jgi:hypothetical protein
VRTSTRFATRFVAALLFVCCSGCSRSEAPSVDRIPVRKTRPLPEVPAGEQNLSSYAPAKPYVEATTALLTRTLFKTAAPSGYSVEVRDIFVDPKKQSGDLSLPGAAFLEVRYGTGVMRAGNRRQELNLGSIIAIPQGLSFSLESTSDQPLTIRVDLVRAQ